jgi:type IV pilus assembly protein PilA
MPMKSRIQGFTIIEMLIVLAILGIVTAIGVGSLNSGRDKRAVLEGQTAFAQSVERVRSLVRRYGYDYRLTIAADNKSYVFKPQSTVTAAAVSNTAPDVVGAMPATVKIKLGTGSAFIISNPIYFAPFGRLGNGGAPICFELLSTTTTLKSAIDLVGVTGKVVTRAISTATPCN